MFYGGVCEPDAEAERAQAPHPQRVARLGGLAQPRLRLHGLPGPFQQQPRPRMA